MAGMGEILTTKGRIDRRGGPDSSLFIFISTSSSKDDDDENDDDDTGMEVGCGDGDCCCAGVDVLVAPPLLEDIDMESASFRDGSLLEVMVVIVVVAVVAVVVDVIVTANRAMNIHHTTSLVCLIIVTIIDVIPHKYKPTIFGDSSCLGWHYDLGMSNTQSLQ
jgi:hypothetical protein